MSVTFLTNARSRMRNQRKLAGMALVLTTAVAGCTDLTENPASFIAPSNYYQTSAQVLGGVAGVYSTLRSTMWEYYNLSEISTDEMVVPTRGQDWYDNGRWLEMHRQGWSPTSGLGTADINGAYTNLSGGIANANSLIDAIKNNNDPAVKQMRAEVRVARAFYYYMMMDFFGGVPLVTTPGITKQARNTRTEIYNFVESELKAARADLPASWPASYYGRFTQGSVDAILASLYLNAGVFTGTVTASGLTQGTTQWAKADSVAAAVINSGNYTLQSKANWIKNFTPDNASSPENIVVIRNKAQSGLGMSFQMRGSHYNQPAGGWNGFSALAQVYLNYDSTAGGTGDVRRQVIKIGQQYQLDGVTPVKDRAGNNLVFTLNIADVTAATEAEGPRVEKFQYDPAHVGGDYGNDFTYFRLGEMYLIRAEALNELGNTAAAITQLNVIKARAGIPAYAGANTQAAVRNEILTERQRELVGEAKRRQDMIRYGASTNTAFYTSCFQYKLGYPSCTPVPAYKVLFPIPNPQIQTNPLLTQNPGY